MKNAVICDVELVCLLRTDVSEEYVTSIFKVEEVPERRKALAFG
jgi:hypothetical protein